MREIPSWLAGTHLDLTDKERGLILRLWKEGISVEKIVKYWTSLEDYGVTSNEARECSIEGTDFLGETVLFLSASRLWESGYDQSAWGWMRVCIQNSQVESIQNLLLDVNEWGINA